MKLTNNSSNYGLVSIALHWCFALGILALLATGVYMVTLTYYHPWYHPLPHYHKLIGIGTLVLFVFRFCWHFFHRQPQITTDRPWERRAAKLTHILMLLLSGAILASGYLIVSVDVRTVEWLGFALPSLDLGIKHQADLAGFWHEYLAYGLATLIGLHLGATLKHQFIDKKPLLKKILLPRKLSVHKKHHEVSDS